MSGLTAPTSHSVRSTSIFSCSSVPNIDANCRTTSGSSVSRRNAMRDIFKWCRDEEIDRLRASSSSARRRLIAGRHLRADDGVVAIARLADVVIQQRQDEQLGLVQLRAGSARIAGC